jgi:putative ubiquitin-RnfH superfamily antitoxin RatB of RatAB toxin-antitoxin module
MATAVGKIRVSVVYAEPEFQQQVWVECPTGSTIAEAIELSGIGEKVPGLDVTAHEVGVYGFKQGLEFRLRHNDRVEIYRPLIVSPTEARRLRARSSERKK